MASFHPGKVKLTSRLLVLVTALVLATGAVLGILLVRHSRAEMLNMIYARMLDIANVAASMVNGDDLATLTKDDADTPEYKSVLETLAHFQDHISLEYIYAIRDMKDGTFTFGPDPTEEDPGEFGSPIESTEALRTAAAGTPAVDEIPYSDAWGRFYSAYSPVFTSSGEVGGIIGVDFDANWLEQQVRESVRIVWIGCLVSMVLGILAVSLVAGALRNQLQAIQKEVSALAESTKDLARELSLHSIHPVPEEEIPEQAGKSEDTLNVLSRRINAVRKQLRHYISHVQVEANMDKLTGVNNQSCYISLTNRLDKDIAAQLADFSFVVLDLDRLKNINDEYGHNAGDVALIDAARLISRAFGPECVFRIGGDEFAAILENRGGEETLIRMQNLERLLGEFNRNEKTYAFDLELSMGYATFTPDLDDSFRAVFRRADDNMYSTKKIHHNLDRYHSRGI